MQSTCTTGWQDAKAGSPARNSASEWNTEAQNIRLLKLESSSWLHRSTSPNPNGYSEHSSTNQETMTRIQMRVSSSLNVQCLCMLVIEPEDSQAYCPAPIQLGVALSQETVGNSHKVAVWYHDHYEEVVLEMYCLYCKDCLLGFFPIAGLGFANPLESTGRNSCNSLPIGRVAGDT